MTPKYPSDKHKYHLYIPNPKFALEPKGSKGPLINKLLEAYYKQKDQNDHAPVQPRPN